MRKLSLCLALFLMFLLVAHEALAQIEFLDGKLRVRGRLEQYMVFLTNFPNDGRDNEHFYRGRALAVNQSIFALEGLFSLVDNGTWKVNFQNYLRWYYESAPDFDSHLQRAFSSSSYRYKKYQTNRFDQDDWINEMYIDAYKGPWNIRLGKHGVGRAVSVGASGSPYGVGLSIGMALQAV